MILLDTCAIIWDALSPNQLTSNATQAINNVEYELVICDISIWEISMLIKRNRLSIDIPAAEFIKTAIQARNLRVQEITPAIAELSVNLDPEVNNDPADRLIAATSISLNAPVVTADKNLRNTSLVETIW